MGACENVIPEDSLHAVTVEFVLTVTCIERAPLSLL